MTYSKTGYDYIKLFRQRCKLSLVEGFNNKCGICGYSKCIEALDFHHLEPSQKEFNISSWNSLNWKKVLIEVKKCVMLCVRCHKEFHSGITKIPKNINRFNEELAEKNFIHIKKTMPMDKCKCGNEKPIHRKYCSLKCSNTQSKPQWDKWDIEKMISHDKLSLTKIADIIGVTRTAVTKRCKKQGINYKKIMGA